MMQFQLTLSFKMHLRHSIAQSLFFIPPTCFQFERGRSSTLLPITKVTKSLVRLLGHDGSLRPWSNEANISPSSVQRSCSVKCWIRLVTSCAVLGVARCCSALFDGNKKCWESNRTFLLF